MIHHPCKETEAKWGNGCPQKVKKDVNKLFYITGILTQCLRYHQIYPHCICLPLGLPHIHETSCYTKMDYVNAAMTNILSPDIIPVELRSMLRHIKLQLPSMLHLPISLGDTFCFYQYLKTHLLVTDGQCLLLIDVPIQDRAQPL